MPFEGAVSQGREPLVIETGCHSSSRKGAIRRRGRVRSSSWEGAILQGRMGAICRQGRENAILQENTTRGSRLSREGAVCREGDVCREREPFVNERGSRLSTREASRENTVLQVREDAVCRGREDTIHRGRDAVGQGGREDAASRRGREDAVRQGGRMSFVDEGGRRLSKTSWMMWGQGRKEEQRISALGNSKFNINNHMMSEFQRT